MNERKILPPRTNRGRRPLQSQQQKAKDDLIYNQLMQRASIEAKQQTPKKQNQRHRIQQATISIQLQLQYKQKMATNRILFPYSRGYHYFFDLCSFNRLQKSFSYAIDADNVFNSTYPQENRVINKQNGLTVGQLFNRHYFGLPICNNIGESARSRDKNVCHGYLFSNEDRKFVLDRNIEQLRRILSRFDKLQQTGDINKFSCLRKDIDLLPILQQDLTLEQKKDLLRKKLKILQQKKQSIKNYLQLQDSHFFYHSLNQSLHNKIQQRTSQLAYKYIASQVECSDYLRQKLRSCDRSNIEQRKNILKRMFSYYGYDGVEGDGRVCISQQMMEKLGGKIDEVGGLFWRKEIDSGFYQISVPFAFFSFCNVNLMSVCEKILALRLAYQNQSSYYICKIFWKKIFGRDLLINKQMKQLSRADYQRTMTTSMTQLQKHKKQPKPQPQPLKPVLDQILTLQPFCSSSKSLDLFPLSSNIEITIREYVILVLFHHLYTCLTQLYTFVMSNQIFCELIASQFFNKAQHYVVECFGSVNVGLIDQVLRRICQWVIRVDFQAQYKLKWVYERDLGVAYVVKAGLESEWETEKEDNDQDGEQNQGDNGPTKRIK